MSEAVICPTCKSNYDTEPLICPKCGFPFSGTEKEKSIFIGKQILNKSTITDKKDKVKTARIVLWVLGGLMILSGFLTQIANPALAIIAAFVNIFLGLMFIAFGFLSYKKPLIAILIPFIIILLNYAVILITDPYMFYRGLLWKAIIIISLTYALISVIQAEKLKKNSDYLKELDK